MANKYCPNCNQMVGTKKGSGGLIIIVLAVVVFLIVPFGTLIALPMLVIGIAMLIFARSRCTICGTTSLANVKPDVLTTSERVETSAQ